MARSKLEFGKNPWANSSDPLAVDAGLARGPIFTCLLHLERQHARLDGAAHGLARDTAGDVVLPWAAPPGLGFELS